MKLRTVSFPLALTFALSCKTPAPEAHDAGASATPPASSSASAPNAPAPSAIPAAASDEIKPVYPSDAGPPDPLAERFCKALSLQDQRRAECRKAPLGPMPGMVAGQCIRTLTAAMHSHAVSVAATDVDRCADAMAHATSGCDWLGQSPGAAPIPAECSGLIHGTLAAKARCHSSLECTGTLQCQGLSVIDIGTCAPAKSAGQGCNLARDTLATYTREDLDKTHPECAATCRSHRCGDAVPATPPPAAAGGKPGK